MGLLLEQQGDLARAAELLQVCVDYEQALGHADAAKDAAYLAELRQRIMIERTRICVDGPNRTRIHTD